MNTELLSEVKTVYFKIVSYVYEDMNIINALILFMLSILNAKMNFFIIDGIISLLFSALVLLFLITKTVQRMEEDKKDGRINELFS